MQLSNLFKIWLKKLFSGKTFVTISKGHQGICCITSGPLSPHRAGQSVPAFSSSNYFCVFGCRKSMLFTMEEMSMTHLLFPYQTIIEFFHSTFLAREKNFPYVQKFSSIWKGHIHRNSASVFHKSCSVCDRLSKVGNKLTSSVNFSQNKRSENLTSAAMLYWKSQKQVSADTMSMYNEQSKSRKFLLL